MKRFPFRLSNLSRSRAGGALPSSPRELRLLDPFSLSGLRVLKKLYLLGCDIAIRGIAGDVVECGVLNGGSAAAIVWGLRDTGRRLWLYDSFEGLPVPKPVDGTAAEAYAGRCVGSVDNVRQALRIAHFPEGACLFRQGWFQHTFAEPLPEVISLLHIDADWYDSVLLALDTFYDRVSEGGIIILDDFGHWEGCREAFYDFIGRRGLKPLFERFGHSQLFWVKGRLNNRSFAQRWEIP